MRQGARGFSLIAAIFVLLVLAGVATFAMRIGLTEEQAVSLELLMARAQSAADSGIEYGANRALRATSCPASTLLNPTAAGLTGFTIRVTCAASTHQIGSVSYSAYSLRSTAWRGNYGTADFVSRTVTRTVTNAPP